MVKVCVLFAPHNMNLVTAAEKILSVEGLMDITEEVDYELQRHGTPVERDIFICDSCRLRGLAPPYPTSEGGDIYHINDSRHNTPLLSVTVPAIVHFARMRRVILGVDPVPRRRVPAFGRMGVVIRPCRSRKHGLRPRQESFDPYRGFREQIARCEESNGAVTEHAPSSCGRGKDG